MSICWCSCRALSRSRLPPSPSKTLAPFLYQTATLQQCRRHASSRPPYRHDGVPFEDDLQFSDVKQQSPRNTTITGSERIAFEKLYKKFSAPKSDSRRLPELDELADDALHEDENVKTSAYGDDLDTLFDTVLAGRADSQRSQKVSPKPKPEPNLATLAAQILKPKHGKAKHLAEQKAARLKAVQNEEKMRISNLLVNAQTDRDLWEVVEKEVFEPVIKLDLDAQKKQGKQGKQVHPPVPVKAGSHPFPTSPTDTTYEPSARRPSRTDPNVLFHNYPHHIVTAADKLLKNFPGSPLIFAILPSLKSQGRSSYALGATSILYRQVILAAWRQNASFSQICNLLQEMDNSGIEFDHKILNLLNAIETQYITAKTGKLGRGSQLVMNMQFYEQDMARLTAWRDVVSKRLGVWMEKRATEGKLIRRVDSSRKDAMRATRKDVHDETPLVEHMERSSEEVFENTDNNDVPLGRDGNEDDGNVLVKNVNDDAESLAPDAKDGHEENIRVDSGLS